MTRIGSGVLAGIVLLGGAACSRPPAVPGGTEPSPDVSPVASPAASPSAQPALDGSAGNPILSWVEPAGSGGAALRFALFEDGAFGTAATVVTDPGLVRDPADPPAVRRLADGSLLAHWTVRHPQDHYAHDLFFAVSRDGGTTWSPPLSPHRDGTAAEHGFASVVADGAGSGATVLWLDGRLATASAGPGAATALYAARWDGAAFGSERLVDPRVCDCCRTAALPSARGWIAAYRDRSVDEIRDIAIVRSDGEDLTPPAVVHDDAWTIRACPTNGPALAQGPAGTIAAAWFTVADGAPALLAAVSRDGGATFAPPARLDAGAPVGRADAAGTPDGIAVVWLERAERGFEIRARLVRPDGTPGRSVVVATVASAKGAGVPRVAFVPPDRLLFAWTDPAGQARVRVATLALPL